jgi:hypothetical protein
LWNKFCLLIPSLMSRACGFGGCCCHIPFIFCASGLIVFLYENYWFDQAKGRLVKSGSFMHSYPFCWRSDTPLIYRAVPSW